MKKGKRYAELEKLVDRSTLYDPFEAAKLVCETGKAKFDETVELHVRLGVDSRHADQQVRGAVVLPHGTGRTKTVLVLAKGPKADEAKAAGAEFVGDDDMIAKIEKASGRPNVDKVATVTWEDCLKIAEIKMPDVNAADVEACARMVAGTARSMGIVVKKD